MGRQYTYMGPLPIETLHNLIIQEYGLVEEVDVYAANVFVKVRFFSQNQNSERICEGQWGKREAQKNETKSPIYVLIKFNKFLISHEFFFKKRDVRRLNKKQGNFIKEFIKKKAIFPFRIFRSSLIWLNLHSQKMWSMWNINGLHAIVFPIFA